MYFLLYAKMGLHFYDTENIESTLGLTFYAEAFVCILIWGLSPLLEGDSVGLVLSYGKVINLSTVVNYVVVNYSHLSILFLLHISFDTNVTTFRCCFYQALWLTAKRMESVTKDSIQCSLVFLMHVVHHGRGDPNRT